MDRNRQTDTWNERRRTLDACKGMIFDLDGTLLDSLFVWSAVDAQFLARRGVEVPADYAQAIAHRSFPDAARYTIARFGLPQTPEQVMDEWFSLACAAYAEQVQMKPGARDYLERLRARGIPFAAATSSEAALFLPCLTRLGIRDWFSAIVTVREVRRGKGFPDIYLLAAQRLGLEAKDCAVFEDILKGVEGARAGGFFTVGVEEDASQADREDIRRMADLYVTDWRAL